MPLYVTRCATVVSLTQLADEAASPPQQVAEVELRAEVPGPSLVIDGAAHKQATPTPAPATPAVPAQPQSGPNAPVSCMAAGGTSLATYLYACGPGAAPQARASLRKHNSSDCAVVPDVDDLLKQQEDDEVFW